MHCVMDKREIVRSATAKLGVTLKDKQMQIFSTNQAMPLHAVCICSK